MNRRRVRRLYRLEGRQRRLTEETVSQGLERVLSQGQSPRSHHRRAWPRIPIIRLGGVGLSAGCAARLYSAGPTGRECLH